MAELPLDQAVPRFKENEDRLDTFVNSATGYTTSGGVSVQSIQQFLASIGSDGIDFVDNAKARFGTGNDLEIYHDGSNSYIDEKGTGSLRIRSAGSIVIEGIDGTNSILADTDAEVSLYYNGSEKLRTTSTGIDVFGTVEFNGLSGTGSVTITDIADEDNMASNSATKLATQQSIKAYVDAQVGTADTLSEVLGLGNTTGGTNISVSASDDITFGDGSKAIFGGGSDLEIFHNGTHSYIKDVGTGDLKIDATNLELRNSGGGEVYLSATANGSVQLYHNNIERLNTNAVGVSVTGILDIFDNNSDISPDNVGSGQFRIDGNGYKAAIALNADGVNLYSTSATRPLIFGVNETEVARVTTTGLDVTGVVTLDSALTLENTSGYGRVEVGGTTGGYIDLKGPMSDDHDLRIITTGLGGTIDGKTGNINLQRSSVTKLSVTPNGINVAGNVEFDGLSGTGSVTITDILDEDDMASNSATKLATQQSIKAYVDANAGGGGGITNVVDDTSPQLGGNLDLNSKNITGTGNIDIAGKLTLESSDPEIFLVDTNTNVTTSIDSNSSTGSLQLHIDKSEVGSNPRFIVNVNSQNNVLVANSTGLDVTGDLDVNGDIGIGRVAGSYTFTEVVGGDERAGMHSNASNELIFKTGVASERMKLTSSGIDVTGNIDATRSGGSTLTLENSITSISANELIGGIDFKGNDTSEDGNEVLAFIRANALDTTPDSCIRFGTLQNNGGVDDVVTERMRLDNYGRLGLGTTSPNHELHIESTSPTIRLVDTDANNTLDITQSGSACYVDFDNTVRFRNLANAERLRIDSGGIDVTGNIGLSSTQPTITLTDTDGPWSTAIAKNGSVLTIDGDSVRVRSDVGTEYMRVTSAGIDVTGTVVADKMFVEGTADTRQWEAGSAGQKLAIYAYDNSTFYHRLETGNATNYQWGTYDNIPIYTITNNSIKTTLLANGNFGIGDSSPEAPLTVTGTIKSNGSGYNPANTGWATNASLITSGSYGGGLTMIDGSNAFSVRVDTGGLAMRIAQGATSGALGSDIAVFTNSGLDVTGNVNATASLTFGSGGAYEAGSIYSDANWGMIHRAYTASPVQADHLFVNSAGTERMRIYNGGIDVLGAVRCVVTSTPAWDTNTRFWGEAGFGARYDSYQHRFDVGVSRTEAMRINQVGNVGIGTAAPKARTQITSGGYATPTLGSVPSGASLYVSPADTAYGLVVGMDNVAPRTWLQSQHTNGASVAYTLTLQEAGGNVGIGTSNATAKLSVAGGVTVSTNLNVGNATPAGGGTIESHVQSSSTPALITYSGSSSLRTHISFENANGQVGKINTAGTQTFYITSSDYRLKSDIQPMQGSIDRVKALNPCNFEWVNDGGRVDGFIAHEVQDVVPEAIVGEKDAMQDQEYVESEATGDIYTPAVDATYETIQVELTPAVEAVYDDEGNELTPAVDATYEEQQQELTPAIDEVIHSSDVEKPDELEEGQAWRETTEKVMATRQVPDYQGIDQSKIVPLLTSALQDAIAKIEALETRLTALES